MKKEGLDRIFYAVLTLQCEWTKENILAARIKADELIGSIFSVCKKNSYLAEVALSLEDGYRLENEGKRAICIGLENGFPIGTDVKGIKRFYDKGVRYITFCHT